MQALQPVFCNCHFLHSFFKVWIFRITAGLTQQDPVHPQRYISIFSEMIQLFLLFYFLFSLPFFPISVKFCLDREREISDQFLARLLVRKAIKSRNEGDHIASFSAGKAIKSLIVWVDPHAGMLICVEGAETEVLSVFPEAIIRSHLSHA